MKPPNNHGPTSPTFAAELLAARADLTLADSIGLALRAHRRRMRMSQRTYAQFRDWPRALVSRLESQAGRATLAMVEQALAPTGYALAVVALPEPGSEERVQLVDPSHWPRTELLARVRGGSRRFPGHRDTRLVSSPPWWWWDRESTFALSVEPHWYCPQDPPSADHLATEEDQAPGDHSPEAA